MALIPKEDRDPVGKALYVEFVRGMYTYQMVITPTCAGNEGQLFSPCIATRRISSYHPRKKWRVEMPLGKKTAQIFRRDPYGELEQESDTEALRKNIGELSERIYSDTFTNLINQKYEVIMKPISFEVSFGEVQYLHEQTKMPVTLYRRIERVRKNQGYPENIVPAVAAD